jgi:hypothetical protein
LNRPPAFLFSRPAHHLYLQNGQSLFRILITPTDILIPANLLFFRQQISAFKGRARNDLERWKSECTTDIRKDSVYRSRSTLKGRISEQMAPLLLV